MLRDIQRRLLGAKPASTNQVQNTLPSLPIEIWWIIFEMVIFTGLLMLDEFESYEIHTAYEYFLDPIRFSSGQCIPRRLAVTRKRKLREVCKAWKQTIDSINLDYRNTLECTHLDRKGLFLVDEWPPKQGLGTVDTSHCKRLILEVYPVYGQGLRIGFRYTHPISALTVRALGGNRFAHLRSLSDIMSFPDQLKVLDLDLEKCKASMGLLKDLNGIPSVPLTTLSLSLKAPDVLQTSLTVPTLISLFLSIPPYDPEVWLWGDPSNFKWTFPALRNLSLIERHYRRSSLPSTMLPSTHHFFANLLKIHLSLIRSLLIQPMSAQVSNQDSSLCWKNMPNLQTLATNFSDISISTDSKYHFGRTPRTRKSDSVRHLIQFHLGSTGSVSMAKELQKYVRACSRLESVTMVDAPGFDITRWSTMKPEKEIIQLLKLCDERGIKVLAQDYTRQWVKVISQKMIGRQR
jgi:hypothetical protein